MKMNKLTMSFLFLLLLIDMPVLSQDVVASVEMADTMRESGKIYVVVAVLSVIFLGLSVFLFTLDRRIRIIEESQRQEK